MNVSFHQYIIKCAFYYLIRNKLIPFVKLNPQITYNIIFAHFKENLIFAIITVITWKISTSDKNLINVKLKPRKFYV